MAVTSSYDVVGYIPISLIKEWVWCPLSAWYMTLSLPEPLPPYVREFEEWYVDDLVMELVTYFGEPLEVRVKPKLRSRRLGISGSPDILLIYKEYAVVVEVKTPSTWSFEEHSKLQLTAYALMASETLGVGRVVAVLATRSGYVEVDWRSLVPKLLSVISKIRRMLESEELNEPPRNDSRCRACMYRRHCPYGGDDGD